MKFTKNNKSSAIFLDSFGKYFLFYFSESKKISIPIKKFYSIVYSEYISNPIPQNRSNTSGKNRRNKIWLPIKTTHYEKYLLSRHKNPYHRKWFYKTHAYNNQKIPMTKLSRYSSYKVNSLFCEIRSENHNSEEK